MIKKVLFLGLIYCISIIYNNSIAPIFINYLTKEYYNNIIISLIILIQIDNFILFYDFSKKNESEILHTKIEDKYLKIILDQITYINRKEVDFNNKLIQFKRSKKKISRSCSDIYNLC